jgi:hypothetical protein
MLRDVVMVVEMRQNRQSTGQWTSLTLPLVEEEAQKASYAAGDCLEDLARAIREEEKGDPDRLERNPQGAV